MSDPKRLFHENDDLGGLLRAGKSEAPSDAHMDALAAKLGALGLFDGGFDGGGGAGGAGGDGGAAALKGGAASALKGGAASAAAAAKGGLAVKVLSGVALAAALGGGAVVVTKVQSPTPVDVPSAGLVARPSSTTAVASSLTAAPLVLEDPLPAVIPSSSHAVVKVAPSTSAPAESEVKMLERAQDALRARPAEALAIADEHARRYPSGMLAQEREVIAIEALSRTGRAADAKARAARFEQRFPGSAQIPRVRSLVGITP